MVRTPAGEGKNRQQGVLVGAAAASIAEHTDCDFGHDDSLPVETRLLMVRILRVGSLVMIFGGVEGRFALLVRQEFLGCPVSKPYLWQPHKSGNYAKSGWTNQIR